jgi:hypothetical protein
MLHNMSRFQSDKGERKVIKENIKMIIDNEKIRATIIVHGNVQRSDYRGRVISTAKNMNITGTVQNLSDGNNYSGRRKNKYR